MLNSLLEPPTSLDKTFITKLSKDSMYWITIVYRFPNDTRFDVW